MDTLTYVGFAFTDSANDVFYIQPNTVAFPHLGAERDRNRTINKPELLPRTRMCNAEAQTENDRVKKSSFARSNTDPFPSWWTLGQDQTRTERANTGADTMAVVSMDRKSLTKITTRMDMRASRKVAGLKSPGEKRRDRLSKRLNTSKDLTTNISEEILEPSKSGLQTDSEDNAGTPEAEAESETMGEPVIYEMTPQEEEVLRYCFRAFDFDGNESLGFTELRKLIHSMGWCADVDDPVLKKWIEKYDTDGSGGLQLSEFMHLMEDTLAGFTTGAPRRSAID